MQMTAGEIIDIIESAAPVRLQESYDNSGLIVGCREQQVTGALLCVDVTEDTIAEAKRIGVNMIISHHPIIFHGLKRLTDNTYVERIVAEAIRNGIVLYACHTNLDQIDGGLSYRLAEILGVKVMGVLSSTSTDLPNIGFGTVGELPVAIKTDDFLRHIKDKLLCGAIRHSYICHTEVKRIAICTGSGSSLLGQAKESGADIYISADFKYNDFIDADKELIIADVGHFESEYCAIDVLFDIIRKKITTFALHKSEDSRNPINYFV